MGSQSAGIGSALPDQTGYSGYILTTDGVTPSWEASSASLPSQTGKSGQYLTTNGTVASWAAVTADSLLPDQTGKSGDYLTTNGTTVSWGAGPGAVSLAAFSSTPSADGLTLTGSVLNMDPADGTHPGGVSIAAQTIAGVKTFSDVPVAAGISAPTTSTFTLAGNRTDGGSNIGVVIDNLVALTTAGAKIVSFQNHEVEKAYIDKDGNAVLGAATLNATTLFGGGPALSFPGNVWFGSPTTGVCVLGVNGAGTTSILYNGAYVAVFGGTSLDLTGMGAGGAIKLKSPDGTTYTATIANGGTWNIA